MRISIPKWLFPVGVWPTGNGLARGIAVGSIAGVGTIRPAPDNAKRRESLADVRPRFGDNMKSMVSPAESTAL